MVKNCWELKNCGREENGKNTEMGICPAFSEAQYKGINNGKNGGRFCWYVSGTFCKGEVQGSFAQKRLSCITCEVFKQIKSEEKDNFVLSI